MIAFANQEAIYAKKNQNDDIARSNNGLGNLSGDVSVIFFVRRHIINLQQAIFLGTLRQFDVASRVISMFHLLCPFLCSHSHRVFPLLSNTVVRSNIRFKTEYYSYGSA